MTRRMLQLPPSFACRVTCSSNELGYYVTESPMHTHDFHATLLHLLGIDHTRLTYRYSGRDFRLTDVHEKVAQAIMS